MAKDLLEKSIDDPKKVEEILGNESLVKAYMERNLRDNTEITEVAAGLAKFAVGNLKPEVEKDLGIDPFKVQQKVTELTQKKSEAEPKTNN